MIARRRLHIESLDVASTEVEGIHKLTIVINETEEVIKKLLLQVDKQVDVFRTFYYAQEDVLKHQQVLYKAAKTIKELEALVKNQVVSN